VSRASARYDEADEALIRDAEPGDPFLVGYRMVGSVNPAENWIDDVSEEAEHARVTVDSVPLDPAYELIEYTRPRRDGCGGVARHQEAPPIPEDVAVADGMLSGD